jgi:hypothetical protein
MTSERRNVLRRRDFVRRAALAGTAPVWAAPIIQSIRAPAYAAVYPVGGFDISFVALLLQCGTRRYRVKFDANGGLGKVCGRNFAVGNCSDPDDQLSRGDPGVQNTCPAGVSATSGPNGSVIVTLGSCTILDFVVKSGQCCAGPGQAGEPPAGGTGSQTFPEPTSNCSDCVSRAPCP